MSEIFHNNCQRIHLVFPGLGSKCAAALICAADLGFLSSRSCYLLWPQWTPQQRNQQSPPLSLLLPARAPSPGDMQEQGKVSLCPCPCPRPWGTQGPELFPGQVWGKLLCQQMEWVGVLQLPRDQEYYRQWQPQLLTHPCQRNPVSE